MQKFVQTEEKKMIPNLLLYLKFGNHFIYIFLWPGSILSMKNQVYEHIWYQGHSRHSYSGLTEASVSTATILHCNAILGWGQPRLTR